MKKIIVALAIVPLMMACTKQVTTRTIGLSGPVWCSVEITNEKIDIDFEKFADFAKVVAAVAALDASTPRPNALEQRVDRCKELFKLVKDSDK